MMRRMTILTFTAVLALCWAGAAQASTVLSDNDAKKAAKDAALAVKEMSSKAPQFAPVRDIFLKQCQTEFKSEDRKSRGAFCGCGADISMVLAVEELTGGKSKKAKSMDAMVASFMQAGDGENYRQICTQAVL